jgi:hypothetical protein
MTRGFHSLLSCQMRLELGWYSYFRLEFTPFCNLGIGIRGINCSEIWWHFGRQSGTD